MYWVITATGQQALESEDSSIPKEYRRLLSLIALHGDTKAIIELLSAHPESLVRDWLRELEEIGFIHFESAQSTADLTIPMALSEFAAVASREAAQALGTAGAYLARTRGTAKGKPRGETVILIVEDDPDQLALADLRVAMAGYQVRTAETVQTMVRSFVDHGIPDLLLLDVVLPDGNGFEVLARLRRHADFQHLPVVLLTALQAPEDIAKGLALGADGYVTKPYSKNVLAGLVSGILE